MAIILGYDQISLDEDSETFDSMEQVLEFAIEQLNGNYSSDMSDIELEVELDQNGYYLVS